MQNFGSVFNQANVLQLDQLLLLLLARCLGGHMLLHFSFFCLLYSAT